MPFFDVAFRRPVVQPAIPQDKVLDGPWHHIKHFHAESGDSAGREFKELFQTYLGFEPEIKSIQESGLPTPSEELGAML
jgi:hypothetical protein